MRLLAFLLASFTMTTSFANENGSVVSLPTVVFSAYISDTITVLEEFPIDEKNNGQEFAVPDSKEWKCKITTEGDNGFGVWRAELNCKRTIPNSIGAPTVVEVGTETIYFNPQREDFTKGALVLKTENGEGRSVKALIKIEKN